MIDAACAECVGRPTGVALLSSLSCALSAPGRLSRPTLLPLQVCGSSSDLGRVLKQADVLARAQQHTAEMSRTRARKVYTVQQSLEYSLDLSVTNAGFK
jgi:hypothetical protein